MTARLTRTLGALGAATLLTFAMAQGCASEGDTNIGDADDDDGSTAAGGTTADGGNTSADGGSGATGPTTTTGGQGGVGNAPYECGEEISEANLESIPADLIVVVDNSTSMAIEADQVQNQMNGFVSAITATGIDARVILISEESDNFIFNPLETGVCMPAPLGSGNCPADENLPGYRHVNAFVDSEQALSMIISTYDQWKDQLRPEATKTFLVVTDDDDAMTAGDFTTALAGLTPAITDFKFNAITASEDAASCLLCQLDCGACTNPCCDTSLQCIPMSDSQGVVYEDLQTQTSGIYGDLCEQNFIPAFNDMADAVIEHTQITCGFDIPDPPDSIVVPNETNVDFIPTMGATPQPIFNVASGVDCTINGGWYFDNNTNPTHIELCPTTCTLVQESTEGSLRVKYGCQTETVPD